MEVTYIVVVAVFTFLFAELMKVFSFNKKFIPLVNIGIGVVSAAVCYFIGVLPSGSPLEITAGLFSCLIASCGAGGFYDVLKTKTTPQSTINKDDMRIAGEVENDADANQ